MKELRLKALAIGGVEVLTRANMKNVLGGSAPDPGPQCANSDGTCKTTSCTLKGGACDGKEGTCGGTTKCSCAGGC